MFDSETEQRALQFLHIYCSDVRSHSSAPESNKQNPRGRTLDLLFFFCYRHIPSLKNLPSPAPNESLPYWFQGNFAASLVLKFRLREFLLSAFANRFELRCEPKRLMLLYYKICPCSGISNASFARVDFVPDEHKKVVVVVWWVVGSFHKFNIIICLKTEFESRRK